MTNFLNLFILFVVSLFFGAIIGAYYGTIGYRIRRDQPLITASCYCPDCGHVLPVWQQIPVVSWLLLKGRCHFCHQPISIRYPLTEGGFILYYGSTFLIFRNQPAVYLLLWYTFICLVLILRSKRHYRSLLKGIGIMTFYHLTISALYLCIYASAKP